MATEHILIVDPVEHACVSLSIILRRSGYFVTVVGEGQQALDQIVQCGNSSRPVDLILTNSQMVGLSGTELILRLQELGIRVPVLVMEGRSFGMKGVPREGVDIIEKPFMADQLLEKVSKALKIKFA
jgi:DNA-binding NtrC family response regulator